MIVASGDRLIKHNTKIAKPRMMSIVGMNIQKELMKGASADRLLKNNTNLANLRMMRIFGMNLHE